MQFINDDSWLPPLLYLLCRISTLYQVEVDTCVFWQGNVLPALRQHEVFVIIFRAGVGPPCPPSHGNRRPTWACQAASISAQTVRETIVYILSLRPSPCAKTATREKTGGFIFRRFVLVVKVSCRTVVRWNEGAVEVESLCNGVWYFSYLFIGNVWSCTRVFALVSKFVLGWYRYHRVGTVLRCGLIRSRLRLAGSPLLFVCFVPLKKLVCFISGRASCCNFFLNGAVSKFIFAALVVQARCKGAYDCGGLTSMWHSFKGSPLYFARWFEARAKKLSLAKHC